MGNAPARIRCYVMELLPFSFTFNLILFVSIFILHFDTFFSLCYYICNKDQVQRTLGQYNWLGWFIPF